MLEYWNNPKATEETLARDGWLKTGDLACLDEVGFVYIKDRGLSAVFSFVYSKLIKY